MHKEARIYVAGHRGLVGSAIVRALAARGFTTVLTTTRADLDLRETSRVERFFQDQRPDYVFVAAARVGGILANDTYPADFIYDNLMIECNVIHASYRLGVSKLLFLGSTCVYPRMAPQPLREDSLLTGPLEPTNEWYAIAKIAGIKLCQAYRKQHGCHFITVMPTNLYGPGDNFDLETSHVLPALIRKFHQAKVSGEPTVVVWGSGEPRRELCHVDDCADACLFLMERYDAAEVINIGHGEDISIRDLALLVKEIVGFEGDIVFDVSRPDGTPRKLVDRTRLFALGWRPVIGLRDGVRATYDWFRTQVAENRPDPEERPASSGPAPRRG